MAYSQPKQNDFAANSDVTQLSGLSIEIQSCSVAVEIGNEDQKKIDQDIESKFQCYNVVLYTYLAIITLETLANFLSILAHPNLKTLFSFGVSLAFLCFWIIGYKSKSSKRSDLQLKFQGLLAIFVIYHIIVCGTIIAESYTTIPYLTYTSFALNIIYGVLIPVVMYYSGDDLRKMFERRAKLASY